MTKAQGPEGVVPNKSIPYECRGNEVDHYQGDVECGPCVPFRPRSRIWPTVTRHPNTGL